MEGDWPFQEQLVSRFLAGGMTLLRDWTEALFGLLCHHVAGTTKEAPTKLIAVMKFDSVEAMKAFGSDEELTETRRQAGAVIESGVMTPISDEFFTNFPESFIQH